MTPVNITNKIKLLNCVNVINIKMQSGGFAMKHEKQQRFSIRKYAVGAASVLIGFAFQAQAVAADGMTPTTTENQPTIHTVSDSPQPSENRTEETPKADLQPEAPKTVETEIPATNKVASLPKTEEKPQEEVSSTPSDKEEVVTPTSAEKETANKKAEEASPKKEADSKESNTDKTDKDKPAEKDAKKDEPKAEADKPATEAGKEGAATENEKLAKLQFKFTDDYPEVVKVKENIAYLEGELAKTVAKSIASENVTISPVQMDLLQKRVVAKNNIEAAQAAIAQLDTLGKQNIEQSNQLSQKSIKFLELQRNAKVSADTYNLLTKSLEELKIKENIDGMDMRVINEPTLPLKHSWPRKLYVMLAGGLLYLVIAGAFIYVQYTRRMSGTKD